MYIFKPFQKNKVFEKVFQFLEDFSNFWKIFPIFGKSKFKNNDFLF